MNNVYRYDVPRRIVHDNGTQFKNEKFYKFCAKFNIKGQVSTPYYPQANGLAEAFNKTLVKILTKIVTRNKKEWALKLPEAFWAYRCTIREPTGMTPYSLVYGSEPVLPLEIQIPSLRIAMQANMTTDENAALRLAELEEFDEQRLVA